MSEVAKGKDVKYYINVIVMLLLMFGFGFLPPIDPITPLGMRVLGIFLGMIWAWSTIGFLWTSLLAIFAMAFTEMYTVTDIFSVSFGNDTTLLVLFTLIFAAYMTQTGLTKYIGLWFISRKIVTGRPYVLAIMIFLANYICGGILNAIACFLICWAIIEEMCDALGMDRRSEYPVFLIIGCVATGVMGTTLFMFRPIAAIMTGTVTTMMNITPTFVQFLAVNMIATIIAIALFIAFEKFIRKPDVSKFTVGEDFFEKYRDITMTKDQKIALLAMGVFLIWILLQSTLPDEWAITVFLNKFTATHICCVVMMLLVALQIKGKSIMDFQKAASQGVNWEIIIMTASTIPIGNMLRAEDTGITQFLSSWMSNTLSGIHSVLVVVVLLLLVCVLTQFVHNMVLAVVLTPIIVNLSVALDLNVLVITTLASLLVSVGLGTPGGSAHAALVFANENVSTKYAFLFGWVAVICLYIGCIICIPIANMVY